jgi:4-alpha-glucanotransferase
VAGGKSSKQEIISDHRILFGRLFWASGDRFSDCSMAGLGMTISPDQKLSGLLAPLFALRTGHDLGIGDTESLQEMVDWASAHGFGLIQILPINETGGDNSPYNTISSLALDPTTIATNPRALRDLSAVDFKKICARHDVAALREGRVDYRGVRALKGELLAAAWKNFKAKHLKEKTRRAKDCAAWTRENAPWLEPYTLFRALVRWHGESENTDQWPSKQRNYISAKKWLSSASPADKRKVRGLRDFFAYVQWIAHSQWSQLKAYGAARGVALVGDVPVGVSIHSADVFAQPGIFDLARSAGAPPEKVFAVDPFTAKWGQNWGFPLYNWSEMAKDDYAWWRQRLRTTMEIFHFLRVDHALGFFRIYSFPWRPEHNAEFLPLSEDEAKARTGGVLPGFVPGDDSTEESRETNRAQGDRLFRMMLEETGRHRLIAEDLGEMSPYVRPVLRAQDIPGCKIPLWEIAPDGWPIPGRDYERLSLATYATHDHPALHAYWDEWYANSQSDDPHKAHAALRQMQEICRFAEMNVALPAPWSDEIHEGLLRGLFASNSWLAVNMITDLFGTSERFNVPGATGDQNWTERFPVPISEWSKHWPEKLGRIERAMRETGRYGA